MNLLTHLQNTILQTIQTTFNVSTDILTPIEVVLHIDKPVQLGDLSCNAAMILARHLKKKPYTIAEELQSHLVKLHTIDRVEIAGPGFINFYLNQTFWNTIARELYEKKDHFFKLHLNKKKYIIEFVSANPTGPLHLGHGRGGIIGDVLAKVLDFLGHHVTKEFYINDDGTQVAKLGASLKARCEELAGHPVSIPEDGYVGDYLIPIEQQCVKEFGINVIERENTFFAQYAKDHLIDVIQQTLSSYGINFDSWFSESKLRTDGSITKVLNEIKAKDLLYEYEGALWFRATHFGDDKDRVIKKQNGVYTYITADIAYHKNKFDRGYDYLIDIMGQDHHGYIKRLKATMKALDYPADNLSIILYQLVSMKDGDQVVKMSKRAGTFAKLADVIKTVGVDVARFFYLNRKAEAHLDFDLVTALKKTNVNPVYYIHYAYVRTGSLLKKAREHKSLAEFLDAQQPHVHHFAQMEHKLIRKIVALQSILITIQTSHQTHLLAYYTLELAQLFHHYYTNNKIIDVGNIPQSQSRLFLIILVRRILTLCLNLLGLSKPEKM